MLFNSYEFILAFLPVTFFVYFGLNKRRLIIAVPAGHAPNNQSKKELRTAWLVGQCAIHRDLGIVSQEKRFKSGTL